VLPAAQHFLPRSVAALLLEPQVDADWAYLAGPSVAVLARMQSRDV
jgi:hypothetical protein